MGFMMMMFMIVVDDVYYYMRWMFIDNTATDEGGGVMFIRGTLFGSEKKRGQLVVEIRSWPLTMVTVAMINHCQEPKGRRATVLEALNGPKYRNQASMTCSTIAHRVLEAA